jgi:branched-chain amino acid transport system substrate-binding protein
MKRTSFWLSCALATVLAACASGGGGGSKPPTASDPNEIVIGVAGPMSEDLAAFGEQLRRGAEQAVADLNASGGVLGKQVRLQIGDDQCNPKRAVRTASNLVDQGVVFVAGHFCSGSSIPASDIYQDAGVLQITPSSTNPKLTERGIATVFRTAGRDDRQGTFAGVWLATKYAGKNVAVVTDGSAYGRQVTDEGVRTMRGNSLEPKLQETYSPKQRDFSTLIAKLKAAQIDIVYVGGYHNDVAPLVRQAREQGFAGAFASVDALNTSEFWSLAGTAGEGVRYSDGLSAVNLPAAKSVVQAFRSKGYEPEGYTLNAYAAVQAWAAGAELAQSTDAAKVAAALKANTVPTVIGDMTWDAKGDMNNPQYGWFVWHGGRAVLDP